MILEFIPLIIQTMKLKNLLIYYSKSYENLDYEKIYLIGANFNTDLSLTKEERMQYLYMKI